MDARTIDLDSAPLDWGRPVVTIGNFDGVHVGHQSIIADARSRAATRGERAAVVTFDPHPAHVINPAARFCRLKTLAQRLIAIERHGIDRVALIRFDDALRTCPPREFVRRILHRTLAVSEVLVGPSFRFGHRREGDLAMLTKLGSELDFTVHGFTPVVDELGPISSTRIRQALASGDVEAATTMLGRPFRALATVERGHGRGRGIGFATANAVVDGTCLPAPGVYATRVEARGNVYRAASFIGQALTFGETRRVFESHLVDWNGDDLYGEDIAVQFLGRIRDPRKFAGVDELVAQLNDDIAQARKAMPPNIGRGRS